MAQTTIPDDLLPGAEHLFDATLKAKRALLEALSVMRELRAAVSARIPTPDEILAARTAEERRRLKAFLRYADLVATAAEQLEWTKRRLAHIHVRGEDSERPPEYEE